MISQLNGGGGCLTDVKTKSSNMMTTYFSVQVVQMDDFDLDLADD